MSTIDPLVTDRLAQSGGERGCAFVDAPVGRLASHAERGESLSWSARRTTRLRARQAAVRGDGHDHSSLRRRPAPACGRSSSTTIWRSCRASSTPRRSRCVSASASSLAKTLDVLSRDDGDQRPAEDRVASQGAEGRHRAGLHDRSGAQGSDADRRSGQRRTGAAAVGAAAREAFSSLAAEATAAKDFSAMVDVLCDLAQIARARLSTTRVANLKI